MRRAAQALHHDGGASDTRSSPKQAHIGIGLKLLDHAWHHPCGGSPCVNLIATIGPNLNSESRGQAQLDTRQVFAQPCRRNAAVGGACVRVGAAARLDPDTAPDCVA
ncbi:MAG: hypothetical protein ACI9MR_002487 [Myxococcota bacterium]|jgi:hypothetical protein